MGIRDCVSPVATRVPRGESEFERRLAARTVQGQQGLERGAQGAKRSKRRFKARIHLLPHPLRHVNLFESHQRRCHDLVEAQTSMGLLWFSCNSMAVKPIWSYWDTNLKHAA